MIETGSPPPDERPKARTVSPLTVQNVSRSSSPGVSFFDGTPRYLNTAPSPPPPPRRSHSTPHLDMAIQPADPDLGHQDVQVKVKTRAHRPTEAQVASDEPLQDPSPAEPGQDGQAGPLPSLLGLSQTLRLEKHHRRTCFQLQAQLHQAQLVAARTSRLLHTARSVQRTLGECIKAEDKHSFVSLFNSFHDAISACLETTPSSGAQYQVESEDCLGYPLSFLDTLSSNPRNTLLEFLTKIQKDGSFISDRLTALSHKELLALLPGKGQSKSSDSVFGSSPRTSSRTSRNLGFVADGQTELLASFEYGCPLEALVHGVRGLSDVPLYRDDVATDAWATVSARLIMDQKSGSERLVPALIDTWAASSEWPGKERLGLWVAELLQNGTPLLEHTSKQSFRVRAGGQLDRDDQEEIRAEAFYADSVTELFGLLSDSSGASVIPEGARTFCQAVCQKLDSSLAHKQAFPNFVLTRWLFTAFLPDAMNLPEGHGLLTDHFISDTARQRLLREVASRAQKAVFDAVYSWKLGTTITTDLAQTVQAIAARFEAPRTPEESNGDMGHPAYQSREDSDTLVPLSAVDICTLVNALYPPRPSNAGSSDRDISRTGLESSASSISGFSLFQNTNAAIPSFSGTPSSDSSSANVPAMQPSITAHESSFAEKQESPSSSISEEILRESYLGIEEFLASRSLPGSQDWCVLLMPSDSDKLCTAREIVLHVSDDTEASYENFAGPEVAYPNREGSIQAIGELLMSDDLRPLRMPCGGAGEALTLKDIQACILDAFTRRIANFEQQSDFVSAHVCYRQLKEFRSVAGTANNSLALPQLLRQIESRCLWMLQRASSGAQWCHGPLKRAQSLMELQHRALRARVETVGRLRDKMWYVAEVRTSAAYDEARSVASALKVMGKPKRPPRPRAAPPLRHWTGAKVSGTGFHLKSEAQVLEILSAPPGHGGPNKLSDDQARALSTWMERNAVENLCSGEERLQRLCMEIRKALATLTSDTSTTWSSTLFAREHLGQSPQRDFKYLNPFSPLHDTAARLGVLTLQTNVPSSIDSISSASSHPLSARSSRDYLDTRSPTLTNRSSSAFWSPAVTEARSPSSATSMGSSQTHAPPTTIHRTLKLASPSSIEDVKDQVRQRAASLLLSDLALALFPVGSETDLCLWTGVGGELTDKHLSIVRSGYPIGSPVTVVSGGFDFDSAFEKLFRLFNAASNPSMKLHYLADIDTLLTPYLAKQSPTARHSRSELLNAGRTTPPLQRTSTHAVADIKVEGFRMLLSTSKQRRLSIFRNLQYIAALVPTQTLGSTPEGKAFWNAAVAALRLKQEACQIMVETADSIILFHSENRGSGKSSSKSQQERDSQTFTVPSRTPSAEDIGPYKMSHAAELLQITAKEGDAVAQRELATLYLTHPELMDHIIAPLSRPRDVFKEELERKWRMNQDPSRCDPVTMCVAHHWMSLSSKGGDALATEYLRQREEMDRLG